MDDTELIQNVLNGNQRDFERLVDKYQSAVFRIAIGLLHNKEDAEEIVQDVFIKVYRSLSSFDAKAAFSTWLYRVTVNASLNVLSKKKRQKLWVELSDLLQLRSKEKQADVQLVEQSDNAFIYQAMNELPAMQRVAFVLSKYEEMPQARVAEIMQLSTGAVEQLIYRAKNNLQEKLEKKISARKIIKANVSNS
ncbi:MAG: sigma-70 family RNA polymerase sigma factor [Chitinophagales bacterium]|nr:sigma-70 family RNA polymerase sigma factor [Chitinophagales bacterium]